MYDVRKVFGFFDRLPPCHCLISADFVPFVYFVWTTSPHTLRTSHMESPLCRSDFNGHEFVGLDRIHLTGRPARDK